MASMTYLPLRRSASLFWHRGMAEGSTLPFG